MDNQRIRPSLADLANLDLDAPAFPEWELNNGPAVSVSRTRPPNILSTSLEPPPVPTIPFDEPQPLSTPPPRTASKPKSRFALQREKEAAEKAANGTGAERFELDFEGNQDGGALPRSTPRPSLVKDVLERPSTRNDPPRPPTALKLMTTTSRGSRPAGFPPLGKGVFPRKLAQQPSPISARTPPTAANPTSFDAEQLVQDGSIDQMMEVVSKENENVLGGMTEAQILEEQRQIREEMGLSEGMIKMLQERAQKRTEGGTYATTSSAPTPRSRPPPSTAHRQQPRRVQPRQAIEDDEEEGTPEYIRKHFFPNEPVNPALDWMKPNPPSRPEGQASNDSSLPSTLTFDLQGALVSNLPETGSGPAQTSEHHVSSSSNFTIPSLLSLTASSVPSQRSTAFNSLHRILSHSSDHSRHVGEKEWTALRHQSVQKAGWALRDPNRGVVMASVNLLHYLSSTEVAFSPVPLAAALQNAEEPKTFLSSFESSNPFPPLALQLSLGTLPRSSLSQLLGTLINLFTLSRTYASTTLLDSIFSTPKLLESVLDRFVAVPWPSSSSEDYPSPLALSFLSNLASSSKSRAKDLYARKLVEPTLRYLAIPPWELSDETEGLGYEMLDGVFGLWKVLARYGVGCELRTVASSLLEANIFSRVGEICRDQGEAEIGWVEELFELMTVWTTAARDPHVTEHDIVWSQVEQWKGIAFEVYEWATTSQGKGGMIARSLELSATWLEGSKVNKSWRGENERKWIEEKFGKDGGEASRLFEEMMRRFAAGGESDGAEEEETARLVAAGLRLSQAYEESANPPTLALFTFDPSLVRSVIDSILSRSPGPSSIDLVVLLLPLLKAEDPSHRLASTIRLLPLLDASHAVVARDLVSFLLSTFAAASYRESLSILTSLDRTLEFTSLVDAPLLNPFYTHLIVTSSHGRVIGPSHPTPRDLKLTHSLLLPPSEPLLSRDWPLSVLDELLRSGNSPVFSQLPKDWDASELQLVKTCLVIMRLVSSVYEETAGKGVEPAPLVYDLMKVYMLEKDTNAQTEATSFATSTSERDLFLNPSIQHSITSLVSPLRFSSLPPQVLTPPLSISSTPPLELVSSQFSSAPFYQLYTDFLGLYDSISLSNPLFSLFLLPPLSQSYPIDYRRLLWTDYQYLIKTIKFSLDDLIIDTKGEDGALSRWLYPRETNETMLKAYLDALTRDEILRVEDSPLMGFLAVHHLSESIFSSDMTKEEEGLRSRLIKGLVGRGKKEVVEMVVKYRQTREVGGELKGLDRCFEIGKDEFEERLKIMRELGGQEVETKLEGLF
ncbi:hypothetical protein JCM16303_001319 [Sporobolomyces ruberrimus]